MAGLAGLTIESTNDAFPAFKRAGWEWVQIAKLTDEPSHLYVGRLLKSKMNLLNGALLTVHEAVYLAVRLFTQEVDSRNARLIAAMLLSNDGSDKDLAALTNSIIAEEGYKSFSDLPVHELCKSAKEMSFEGTLSGGAHTMDFALEEEGKFKNILSLGAGSSNFIAFGCENFLVPRKFKFGMSASRQVGQFHIEIKVDGKTWFSANYPTHPAGDFGGFEL